MKTQEEMKKDYSTIGMLDTMNKLNAAGISMLEIAQFIAPSSHDVLWVAHKHEMSWNALAYFMKEAATDDQIDMGDCEHMDDVHTLINGFINDLKKIEDMSATKKLAKQLNVKIK